MRLLFFLACIPGAFGASCAGRVVNEKRGEPTYYSALIAVPARQFAAKYLEAYFQCTNVAERAAYISVFFEEDSPEALALMPQTLHRTLSIWLVDREQERKRQGGLAQIWCVRGDCVLRFSGRAGGAETRVLRGKNPLLVSASDISMEILHVSWLQDHEVRVFARAAAPLTEQNGVTLLTALVKFLPVRVGALFLRNDIWFIEPGSPAYYPYAPEEKVPTQEKFDRASAFHCYARNGEPACYREWQDH